MNLICGINPVLEALAAGTRHFDRLLVVKGLRSRRLGEAIRRATQLHIPLRFEMRETLDRLASGVPHQGVIAIVSGKPLLSLEGLLDQSHAPALVVVLDGIEDPRNLGAILRTAEAAGADGVVLPDRHSAGLSETVARASAGALEHVRVARVGNLVQALEALKARGVWIVGFDAAGTERWDTVDMKQPLALVLGGEGRGMRRLVREHCDHLVSIPQFGHVGSLNVSVAAGIALYEAVRQRGTVPSQVRPIPARPPAPPQIVGPGPDDVESDPGAPAHAAVERPEAEEDDDPAPRVDLHVDILDEVAWGSGPIVLKPVGFGTLRRPGAGRRRRKGGGPGRPPAFSAVGEATEGSPAQGEGAGVAAAHGRRRRRRRRQGGPHPAGPEATAIGQTASRGEGDGGADSGATGAEPGAPPGRRGRRRRRRRRRNGT
jgi:23S rRNA (guanosine2251-2'-O)-methyltransferase